MDRSYTLLFEHTSGGIAEHAVPVAAEWIRRGHVALVMTTAQELPAVQKAHEGLAVRYEIFGGAGVDWANVNAIFNVIPGEPGPIFRDIRGRCDIPRVTINHGLTDKQTTFPADFIGNGVGYANVLFACGPAMFKGSWEKYIRKWPEILHSLKVVPIGSPKTDVLFDGTFQRDEVLQSLGLDPKRPAVLYAPTYQKEASLEQAGEDIIQALVSLPISVIVRPHHLSMRKEWMDRLRELEAAHSNLRVIASSSNPLFVAADLLVGDVSGACFEYILQDKPVVFYDVPAFFEAHGRAGVGYWGRDAGTIVKTPDELRAAVMSELLHPERMAKARKSLIGQLVSERGGAAVRAVDALLDMIEGRLDYPTWGPRQCLRQDTMLRSYLLERLERCALETESIALFGAGAHASWLLDFMQRVSATGRRMPCVTCILDDHAISSNATLNEIPIVAPCKEMSFSFDAVIFATDYHQAAFRKRCEEVFGKELPTIDLYEPFPWHRPHTTS
ncbi:MAG: hypothetical protein A2X46_16025 [Lentisphaerae bacterium GWF2_57_35]|nr:MAG: hypothetical protein A2X46_16025 [Lentisphaerae bacterium GWF2_57_35]